MGGEVESSAAPVDVELDVFLATLVGDCGVCVYRMAFVDGAICDARNVGLCGDGDEYAEAVVRAVLRGGGGGVFISPRKWIVEFCMQVGDRSQRKGAKSSGDIWLGGRNYFYAGWIDDRGGILLELVSVEWVYRAVGGASGFFVERTTTRKRANHKNING